MTHVTFSFGKNWEQFLSRLDKQRLESAQHSLRNFIGLDDFKGKSFLDIGSGSGIYSHSAFNLGAEKVVSFDIDPFSVYCTSYMKEMAGNPDNWEVFEGSILDDNDTRDLEVFDIVHAWGVLHHTGSMWEAVRRSARLVKPGGYFYIAIYNKIPGRLGSLLWRRIKKFYNRSPWPIKRVMELSYNAKFCLHHLIRLKNPLQKMRNHKSKRGMDWNTDVRDWLGGLPYEFATVEELFVFVKKNFPEFDLMNLKSCQDYGNNYYVFKRRS